MDKNIDCQNPSVFRYTWPGRDEACVCLDHAQGIMHVAQAIGLHLQMIPLSENDRKMMLQCTSKG